MVWFLEKPSHTHKYLTKNGEPWDIAGNTKEEEVLLFNLSKMSQPLEIVWQS